MLKNLYRLFFLFACTFTALFAAAQLEVIVNAPANTALEVADTGWYKQGETTLYWNAESVLKQSYGEVNNLPLKACKSEYPELELAPMRFEGARLEGEIVHIASFKGIKPLFGNQMALLTINLENGSDHFINKVNSLKLPHLKDEEQLIYYIYPVSPSNLKLAFQGGVGMEESFMLNGYWKTAGNTTNTGRWNLSLVSPRWYSDSGLSNISMMINDEPAEPVASVLYYLIDGIQVVPASSVKSNIAVPGVLNLGQSIGTRIVNVSWKFWLLFLAIFILSCGFIYKLPLKVAQRK